MYIRRTKETFAGCVCMEAEGVKQLIIRDVLVAAGLMTIVFLGLLAAVCVCADRTRIPKPGDCIIVLGARVWPSGRMSNSLKYRCESALEAWKGGIAQNIIVTGGQGADEPVSEASAMRAYFLENGVPEENVFAEDASANTIENFKNAKKIMEDRGWRTAVVVTNDYHVQRALWIARDAGISASAAAAKSPDRISTRVISRLRETVSWCLYAFRRIF